MGNGDDQMYTHGSKNKIPNNHRLLNKTAITTKIQLPITILTNH